ncbi:MAG TPA: hypothetical protein VIR02_19225, partial [Anaerolineales bacterium]
SKYGKLAYSTHLPFNVLPVKESYAPDAMVSLTLDGKTFAHRTHTRAGDVAPGFMWCKFDQVLGDELQSLWIGVLLWRDIQIRLTVLRPTLPVMAFESPGALGCEKPTNIVRRSDDQMGWEYADSDGRAVAIQRLTGYECQRASAPFLDQSNINVAYTYSEQPMLYESQASVAARCLASAALVRPAPFDPAQEFAGIEVEIESPEIFRLTLPDGSSALVTPGETTPKHATVHGLDVEGSGMRYIRVSNDSNEISGLGVTHITGIAAFERPATFRLKRTPEGTIRVTTNSGFSLSDPWLDGHSCRIEGLTLDKQWQDVTAQCKQDSIPAELVQDWSERNQRTLVDFRIST